MLRSQLVLACGLNILTSINALAKGDQRFLALTSSRAPGVMFEPCGSFSPVSGSSGGSIWTSLQTSSRISANRSLRDVEYDVASLLTSHVASLLTSHAVIDCI